MGCLWCLYRQLYAATTAQLLLGNIKALQKQHILCCFCSNVCVCVDTELMHWQHQKKPLEVFGLRGFGCAHLKTGRKWRFLCSHRNLERCGSQLVTFPSTAVEELVLAELYNIISWNSSFISREIWNKTVLFFLLKKKKLFLHDVCLSVRLRSGCEKQLQRCDDEHTVHKSLFPHRNRLVFLVLTLHSHPEKGSQSRLSTCFLNHCSF